MEPESRVPAVDGDETLPTTDVRSESPEDRGVSFEKYRSERLQLSAGIEEVKRRALTGALRVSRLRSVAWAILLNVLPENSSSWIASMRQNRKSYEELVGKFACDPRRSNNTKDDPLSQKNESAWNRYFQNDELRGIIRMDVNRTFPGVEIFKQTNIRDAMSNVLFIYAKYDPDLEYKQGMHEILAVLLFVLHCDHRSAEQVKLGNELTELMDPNFLEHDAFSLFRATMVGLKKFYSVHIVDGRKVGAENEIIEYLRKVKEDILSQYAPDLVSHLEKFEVPYSLFGVRWLRLLFGREFPLHDLLVLWDAILAEGADFQMAAYVMVSMMMAVKNQLLRRDYMECLTMLLHYPATVDVQFIIDHALYLRHPDQYCKPTNKYFNCVPVPRDNSSAPVQLTSNKFVNFNVAPTAEDSVIDGVLCQETSNIREELAHLHKLLYQCSSRLEKYETTLRRYIPEGLPNYYPAYRALDGIHEVGQMLKPKNIQEQNVEAALEADESERAAARVLSPNPKTSVDVHEEPSEAPMKLRKYGKEVQLKPRSFARSPSSYDTKGMPRAHLFDENAD